MAPVAVTVDHRGMAYARPSVSSIGVSPETTATATRPAQRSCAGAPWWSPCSSNRQEAVERIKSTASIAKKLAAVPAVRYRPFIPQTRCATLGPDECRLTHRKRSCRNCARAGRRGGSTSRCGVGAPSQKPKDSPVVNENFERAAGPAKSAPAPASQTMLGVSWYRRPISTPTTVDSPRVTG